MSSNGLAVLDHSQNSALLDKKGRILMGKINRECKVEEVRVC